MSNPTWYDIEMRGRRLEGLSKVMTTEFSKALKKGKTDLALAYLDRFTKIEHTIQPYVEQMTGLNRFLKKHAEKENTIPA